MRRPRTYQYLAAELAMGAKVLDEAIDVWHESEIVLEFLYCVMAQPSKDHLAPVPLSLPF